jgi:hypothetical protein
VGVALGAGGGIAAYPGLDDVVQGGVGSAVSAAGETVSTRGRLPRRVVLRHDSILGSKVRSLQGTQCGSLGSSGTGKLQVGRLSVHKRMANLCLMSPALTGSHDQQQPAVSHHVSHRHCTHLERPTPSQDDILATKLTNSRVKTGLKQVKGSERELTNFARISLVARGFTVWSLGDSNP